MLRMPPTVHHAASGRCRSAGGAVHRGSFSRTVSKREATRRDNHALRAHAMVHNTTRTYSLCHSCHCSISIFCGLETRPSALLPHLLATSRSMTSFIDRRPKSDDTGAKTK